MSTATSDFLMHGARSALAEGLAHIEEQVKAIERAVVENPGLAFDLAKTIVESVCKSILAERRIAFESADDLPKLFKMVTTCLPLLPSGAPSTTASQRSLKQTLGGLHGALQGVCELRNSYGFASHGSDGQRPTMEAVQALLAAQAADAIVGFLHRIHREEYRAPTAAFRFDNNGGFNDFVDGQHEPVQIFNLTYRPSEVLFRIDVEAYRDALANYDGSVDDEQGAGAPTGAPTAPVGSSQ